MKLVEYKKITGDIELISGLHIGGSVESTQIGGMDSFVIRLAHNNMPYIPGSSIKGKMRSLLELKYDKVDVSKDKEGNIVGNVHKHDKNKCIEDKCIICHLFGISASGDIAALGPSRLIVRDCLIDEENETNKHIMEISEGLPFSESKMEVTIDRIRGSAMGRGLRNIERVPAGTVFKLDMTLRVFEGDAENLIDSILEGLALIQADCLGGSGSRGYGRVKFSNVTINNEPKELPEV